MRILIDQFFDSKKWEGEREKTKVNLTVVQKQDKIVYKQFQSTFSNVSRLYPEKLHFVVTTRFCCVVVVVFVPVFDF